MYAQLIMTLQSLTMISSLARAELMMLMTKTVVQMSLPLLMTNMIDNGLMLHVNIER